MLLNLHEFHGTDLFADILAEKRGMRELSEVPAPHAEPAPPALKLVPLPPGPTPIRKKFPRIVQETPEFIQLHGFSAQKRRQRHEQWCHPS